MGGKSQSGRDIDESQQPQGTVDEEAVDGLLSALGLPLKKVVQQRGGCPEVVEKIVDAISHLLWQDRAIADGKRADQGTVYGIVEGEHRPVEGL